MAVKSTYLAVWDLTSTRRPDWRNSFTPTERQRRLTWGFQNAQMWIFRHFCVVWGISPMMGWLVRTAGVFYQIQAGLLASLNRPYSGMDLVHLRVVAMERLWE